MDETEILFARMSVSQQVYTDKLLATKKRPPEEADHLGHDADYGLDVGGTIDDGAVLMRAATNSLPEQGKRVPVQMSGRFGIWDEIPR